MALTTSDNQSHGSGSTCARGVKKEKNMKGIKTEVKTDWKNLMHGQTKNLNSKMPKGTTYASRADLPTEGKLCLSYHVKWSGGSFYPRIIVADNVWLIAGKDIKDTQGEEDIVWIVNASQWKTSESHQQIPFFVFTGVPQSAAINATISNIMLNTGNKPLPYIDSDELKATGGGNS